MVRAEMHKLRIGARTNIQEFVKITINSVKATVGIKADHIHITIWHLWGSPVKSIPNGVSDEPGSNPAVWQFQMRHYAQQSPPDCIAMHNGSNLSLKRFGHRLC